MSSLINESPLTFSAQLAETIGLEEAILLQLLHASAAMQAGVPYELSVEALASRLSFWRIADIQRILKSLSDKGVVEQLSPPISQTAVLQYRFDRAVNTRVNATIEPIKAQGANRISPYWQPDENVLQQLAMLSIPADFARQLVAEFVTYWQERGEVNYSWSSQFIKHVKHAWERQRSQPAFIVKETPQPLQAMWQPSRDALDILHRNGINPRFIEDAVPEFILYWREKGTATSTWNSMFIQHVKKQWARYTSAMKYDTEPRRIPANWQPTSDVFDILRMANIDDNFAKSCVHEFVLYWKDSNQMHSSWNTKFLQHVKYCWANQHQLSGSHYARQQLSPGKGETEGSFVARHSDRSWADGL